MAIQWWYWALGGILLVLLELVVPSFFILWFGLGALLVAGALLLVELSLSAQLLLWTLASLAMLVLWLRVFSPRRQRTLIGSAGGEVLGEVGLLVGAVAPFQRGKVRFQRPILGAEEWTCMADAEIPAGTRVKVLSIEGSYLKVARA